MTIQIIETMDQAACATDEMRIRILSALSSPQSATTLAHKFDVPRQKLNYHIKQLETAGLIEVVEERRKRNCIERLFQRKAQTLLFDPNLFGPLNSPKIDTQDRFSWTHVIALLMRSLTELVSLRRIADKQHKKVASFAVDGELSFSSPQDFDVFAKEASQVLQKLAQRYNQKDEGESRRFRLLLLSHAIDDK